MFAEIRKVPTIIWMFIGVLLYETTSILALSFSAANYIKMLGVLIAIYAFYKAPKRSIPSSIKLTYTILIITIVCMILRGSIIGRFPPDTNGSLYGVIRYFLVYNHSAFAVLLPMVMVVDFREEELKYYKQLAVISSIISLCLVFAYSDYIFSPTSSMGLSELELDGNYITIRELAHSMFVGLGFLLFACFSYPYIQGRFAILFPLVLFLYFAMQVMGGGRGGSVMAFGYLLLFFVIAYNGEYVRRKERIMTRLAIITLVIVFICVLFYLYRNTNMFEFLIYRAFDGHDVGTGLRESTRETFVDALVSDFNNSPLCWLFGRGVNGVYRLMNGQVRYAMEWGFLWLVLKGGIIYLISYVMLLLKPAIKGLFRSSNHVSKVFAVMCIIQVLSLIPFGVPAVSTMFLLTWRGARLIADSKFRYLSNQEIYNMINSK